MSIITAHFYWFLSLIPVYALYKLWVNFLSPWFFAGSPQTDEDGADDGKKHRRREKKTVLRR